MRKYIVLTRSIKKTKKEITMVCIASSKQDDYIDKKNIFLGSRIYSSGNKHFMFDD